MEPADIILSGGKIITADARFSIAQSVAIRAGRFIAVGEDTMVQRHAAPHTRHIALDGRAVLPGLIDGHAHMDREGLKDVFPSLAGCRSIAAIQARIAELAKDKAPGEWIVTMPVGEPPFYWDLPESLAEGRWPTRQELDDAAPRNPVYIRPIWGFWRHSLPLVSIANTMALKLAGITRETAPPHPSVTIRKDAAGEPDGVIIEQGYVPLMELAAFHMAPGFTHAHRVAGLPKSAAMYHAFGTTSIYEEHGVAAELLAAYREVHAAGKLTMRSHLALSPDWRGMEGVSMERLISGWAHQLAGAGLGDDMLRLSGLITEIGRTPDNALRAQAAPYTGWAGFNYDMGLDRERAKDMLIACARHSIRAIGIWPNMLDLFAEVNEVVPIRDLRWVLGHIAVLSQEQVHRIRDLGLVLTTHTNRYIYKEGHLLVERNKLPDEDSISPLRWLEEAGVTYALATDNVPVSMFYPMWQAVSRQNMHTQRAVGERQAISRESAIRAATNAGAYLTMSERDKGAIEPGKLADLAVLTADPLTVELSALKDIAAEMTMVGGEIVHRAPGTAQKS
ncbi:amidohydrolase [Sediminicoccus rosea]|uniref:Amidohydrolase family protein n=1 Tax=Sediminicoccus rosea TaxID=1225128 RepID=A0ABZ0PIS5_9PROT|nr:amidohydrolase family protein [Sediminicoccus rosea]WPB85624.1 amidohydrolase family protein [Sediminicoccus rosea]